MTLQLRTHTPKHAGMNVFPNSVPTPEQQAIDERRAGVLRDLITTWIEQTGCKVLIAPEAEKEIEHNKRLLMDPLAASIQGHVVLREKFWNADEAASVFARAGVVVCHEPHSCIIAMANGTPILHLYSPFRDSDGWDHHGKCHMFVDVGVSDWMVPLDEWRASDLFDRLQRIHADPVGAREQVRQAMGFVDTKFAEATETIRRALEEPCVEKKG